MTRDLDHMTRSYLKDPQTEPGFFAALYQHRNEVITQILVSPSVYVHV